MGKDLEKAIELLNGHKEYTCVFVKGEKVFTSTRNGIAPLLSFVEEGKDVSSFSVADRIVGKAASLLYVDLKIEEVYGEGIPYSYKNLVEGIRNRTNTGSCPMEMAVKDIEDPSQAPKILRETINKLRKGK